MLKTMHANYAHVTPCNGVNAAVLPLSLSSPYLEKAGTESAIEEVFAFLKCVVGILALWKSSHCITVPDLRY